MEKASNIKTIRKLGSSFTPSIKDALSGNSSQKNMVEEQQNSGYNEYENYTEPFTSEQLAVKWNEFLMQIADRPNLQSTLSTVPEISNGNQLVLIIGNSVQEDYVRQIKPELVTWLRKELRNSEIELTTRLEKIETERTFFSDTEKLQLMMQKNPELYELKKIFNLDFKD